MKKIIFVLLSLMSAAALADSHLYGSWQQKSYDIRIDTTFDSVRGSYGDQSYDLNADSTFNTVRGTSAGQDIDMSFDDTFKTARGTASCGNIDLTYDTTFNTIRGTFCDSAVDERFSSSDEVRNTFALMVMDELVRDFPPPTRGVIMNFFLSKVHF
jgi:hypothetical protein